MYQPTSFDQLFHQLARLALSVTPSRSYVGIGILTDFPSPTFYRYSCLHAHFYPLQRSLRYTFNAE